MLTRLVSAISPFLIVAAAVGCTEGSEAGQGDFDETELKKDGVAPTAAQLAKALGADGVFGLSPRAKAAEANYSTADVEVQSVDLSEDNDPMIGALVEPLVKEILEGFAADPELATSPIRLLNQPGDVYVSTHFGWDPPGARSYLLKTVNKKARTKIEKLVSDPDLNAYFYWLQIDDSAAEYTGADLFVIVPMTWDDEPIKAVVVRLAYADT